MRILALETCTDIGSVALWHDGRLIERLCPAGQAHSQTLLPLIQSMLSEAGWALGELDGIAFGTGPGAFTGLRVACSIAQGLALGSDLGVLPIGSLAALAYGTGETRCLAVLDARMGEIYSGFFERSGDGMIQHGELTVIQPTALNWPTQPALVAGNALRAYPFLIESAELAGLTTNAEAIPGAGSVAALGAIALANGECVDAAMAVPLYVRNKVAQTVAERLLAGGKA